MIRLEGIAQFCVNKMKEIYQNCIHLLLMYVYN